MPARKMRVELFDGEGNRYTVAFEGQITRERALKILDLVELLGGMPGEGAPSTAGNALATGGLSRFEKMRSVIQKGFPLVWFSSKDIQSVYEQDLREPISLSTVSTYLSRMATKGMLMRTGGSNSLRYKTVIGVPQVALRQQTR